MVSQCKLQSVKAVSQAAAIQWSYSQPASQSWLISQSISQPITTISHSVSQSVSQSIGQSVSQSVSQSASQSASHSTHRHEPRSQSAPKRAANWHSAQCCISMRSALRRCVASSASGPYLLSPAHNTIQTQYT